MSYNERLTVLEKLFFPTLCLAQNVPGAAGSSLVTHRLFGSLHHTV
jgi:hypothetical protein